MLDDFKSRGLSTAELCSLSIGWAEPFYDLGGLDSTDIEFTGMPLSRGDIAFTMRMKNAKSCTDGWLAPQVIYRLCNASEYTFKAG